MEKLTAFVQHAAYTVSQIYLPVGRRFAALLLNNPSFPAFPASSYGPLAPNPPLKKL